MHSKLRHKIVSLNSTKWKGINKICPFTYLETGHSYSCSPLLSESWKNNTNGVAGIILFTFIPNTLLSIWQISLFSALWLMWEYDLNGRRLKRLQLYNQSCALLKVLKPSWFCVLYQTALNLSCSGSALFWGHVYSWGVLRVLLF